MKAKYTWVKLISKHRAQNHKTYTCTDGETDKAYSHRLQDDG